VRETIEFPMGFYSSSSSSTSPSSSSPHLPSSSAFSAFSISPRPHARDGEAEAEVIKASSLFWETMARDGSLWVPLPRGFFLPWLRCDPSEWWTGKVGNSAGHCRSLFLSRENVFGGSWVDIIQSWIPWWSPWSRGAGNEFWILGLISCEEGMRGG